jgi:hypothetical protein
MESEVWRVWSGFPPSPGKAELFLSIFVLFPPPPQGFLGHFSAHLKDNKSFLFKICAAGLENYSTICEDSIFPSLHSQDV